MRRLSIVGTTKAWVTRSRSTVASHACGSNCGRIASRRPDHTEPSMVVAPAMWKKGTETSVTSCSLAGSAGACVLITYAVSVLCVSTTPFGCAVVPEV